MAIRDDKKNYPTLISDEVSFEDLIQDYQRAFQEITEAFNSNTHKQEEITKRFAEERKAINRKLLSELLDMENANVKQAEEYRKKLADKANKQELKDRLAIQNKFLEEEAKQNTKSYKKQERERKKAAKELNKAILKEYEKIGDKNLTAEQREDKRIKQQEVKQATLYNVMDKVAEGIKKLGSIINTGISSYVRYQQGVNARLQGATRYESMIGGGRFLSTTSDIFGAIENKIMASIGVNPYVRTEDVLANLQDLVARGIASNVEQRAFLTTVKDNIATTFDAANSALLRIIRLQQSDSTAARLGMEAYLTRFLNNLEENTEYLTTTFDGVQEALLEASSQMTTQAASEMEFIVQKWLGSLVGVGFSEQSALGIAQAIGYLGSGNASKLAGNQYADLLVMAASRSNISYADILKSGLTAGTANLLMRSLAEYIIEIGKSSNNVVRSAYAETFGLNISDITAATNLAQSLDSISRSLLSYSGMYGELTYQMQQLPSRISGAQLVDTLLTNAKFSLASNIAQNPVLASIWAINDMIESATGGIPIPSVLTFGSGILSNSNVNQLIKLGLVGVSSLGMIGDVITGLGRTFSPASMLSEMGIFNSEAFTAISRGTGLTATTSGLSTSASSVSYVAGSGTDIASQAVSTAEEEAQERAGTDPNAQILPDIRDILKGTAEGDSLLSAMNTNLEDIKATVIAINNNITSGSGTAGEKVWW